MNFLSLSLVTYTSCFLLVFAAQERCNVDVRQLSKSQRSIILKTHNKMRQMIRNGKVKGQPQAQKLQVLKWDKVLGKAAQKHADRCLPSNHTEVKDERWLVGQNIFHRQSTAYSKGINLTEAVYSWFDEHRFYKYPKYSKKTGHYTQIVWEKTRYLGCGYTSFKTTGKFKYNKLLVCNYGPAGNYLNEAPYKRLRKNR